MKNGELTISNGARDYQLSITHFQLSIINNTFSIIHFQLSIII